VAAKPRHRACFDQRKGRIVILEEEVLQLAIRDGEGSDLPVRFDDQLFPLVTTEARS